MSGPAFIRQSETNCPALQGAGLFLKQPSGLEANMDPEIVALIERLAAKGDLGSKLAANILQAVFDPENQPSQYGTMLMTKPQSE
jgi:hypothetical protein